MTVKGVGKKFPTPFTMYEAVVSQLITFPWWGRKTYVLLQHVDKRSGRRECFDIMRSRRFLEEKEVWEERVFGGDEKNEKDQ